VLDILERQGAHCVAGIIDSYVEPGTEVLGLKVLGTERDLPRLAKEYDATAGIVAIGDNFARHTLVESIQSVMPDFAFVSAVHPSAQIGRGVSIGVGTVVMAGAIINPNSRVEEHCIVNTNSSVDHDNVIGRFSSIGPGATTGGNVRMGEFSALSLRAAVLHGRAVGIHSVIGAAATVVKDIPDYVVAYGTPARVVRARKPGDRYL
jgi:sugar O-acyltransferase (sialic acid O-acetyltransferase NeuD family)